MPLIAGRAVIGGRAVHEAQGQVRQFQLSPRLTAHVRHRTKISRHASARRAGLRLHREWTSGAHARTLKEFTGLLAMLPAHHLVGHFRRHDFSHWIDEVFRDHPLAAHIHKIEIRADSEETRDVADAIG